MKIQSGRTILAFAVGLIIIVGAVTWSKTALGWGEDDFVEWFGSISRSDWVLLIIIGTYIAASFLILPQWALYAATVMAIGLPVGGLYAWIGTMIAASINFFIGRWAGAERLQRFGGDTLGRIINLVRRNGFLASFAVRLVPTGPFLIVNMAAGVSKMRYSSFFSGTALGIIPKILVFGLLAQGVISGAEGDSIMYALIPLAILFVIIIFIARKRLSKLIEIEENINE